jgi:hypothetical protein
LAIQQGQQGSFMGTGGVFTIGVSLDFGGGENGSSRVRLKVAARRQWETARYER